MRLTGPALLLLMLSGLAQAAGEIREFDLPTIEKLGQTISQQDSLSGRAEDLVRDQFPEFKALPKKGWITELRPAANTVYLLTAKDSDVVLSYSVTFPPTGGPIVKDRRGEALPANIATRARARETALKSLQGKFYDAPYNVEVLDDPKGSGFLVYALAASGDGREVILGGHFRISVSADGATAERVDALSHGIIKLDRATSGGETAGFSATQAEGKLPVETFVYSSALYGVPIFVATRDGKIWRVANGKITK